MKSNNPIKPLNPEKIFTHSIIRDRIKIFVSAGEPSGDKILAQVIIGIKSMYPNIELRGIGGEKCRKENLNSMFSMTHTAVNGIWDVLLRLPFFLSVLKTLKTNLLRFKPDLVILVDFPGINVRLLKISRKAGFKTYYICPPQAWAYKKPVLDTFKNVHVQIPFEMDRNIYLKAGAKVHEGHFFNTKKESYNRKNDYVCICPGSRKPIIKRNLPLMLNLISHSSNDLLKQCRVIILVPRELITTVKNLCKINENNAKIRIEPSTQTAFSRASLAVAFPGTVNMELALAGIPYVVVAKIDPITWITGKILLKTKLVSLPNVLMKSENFPELLTFYCNINQDRFDKAIAHVTENPTSCDYLRNKIGREDGPDTAIKNCVELLAENNTHIFHTS